MLCENKYRESRRTVRFVKKNWMGIIAFSFVFHCQAGKSIFRALKPTKSPIGFDDDHGTLAPPSCDARIKHETAAISMTTAGRSSLRNLVVKEILHVDASTSVSVKKRAMRKKLTLLMAGCCMVGITKLI